MNVVTSTSKLSLRRSVRYRTKRLHVTDTVQLSYGIRFLTRLPAFVASPGGGNLNLADPTNADDISLFGDSAAAILDSLNSADR